MNMLWKDDRQEEERHDAADQMIAFFDVLVAATAAIVISFALALWRI